MVTPLCVFEDVQIFVHFTHLIESSVINKL